MREVKPADSRIVMRLRVFVAVAVCTALLSTAGLVASLWVKSPGQRAAEQAPPSASVLTAPVRQKILEKTVVVRGTVGASSQITITGASTATAQSRRIVTAVGVSAGANVISGTVLGTIAGRPIIVFVGEAPAYRDLVPGLTGADVSELQAALIGLGVLTANGATGTFDRATQAAVSAVYGQRSLQPLTTVSIDPSEPSRIHDLETTALSAQRAVEDAKAALNGVPAGTDKSSAARAVTRAQQDLASARGSLSAARAASGVILPLAEAVFAPMPALVSSVTATVGAELGSTATPTFMTLAAGSMTVQTVLPAGSQEGIAKGAVAQVIDDESAMSKAATVTALGEFQPPKDSSGAQATSAGYPVTVTIPEATTGSWIGRSVRVRIFAGATQGPVLVAPLTAIRSRDDGTSYVVVVDGINQREVAVRPGLVSAGEVEVTPVETGTLASGAELRLG